MTHQDFAIAEPFPEWAWPQAWNWAEKTRAQIADDFFPPTIDAFVEFSLGRYSRTFGLWLNGSISGAVAVEHASPVVMTAHILLSRRLWGIPASDLRTVAQLLFESEPQLIRIQAYVPAWNRLAIALAKRLGGTVEGTLRSATMRGGCPADAVLVAMTRGDFENGPELGRGVQFFELEKHVDEQFGPAEHVLAGADEDSGPDRDEPVERSGVSGGGKTDTGNYGSPDRGERRDEQDRKRSDRSRKQLPRSAGVRKKRSDGKSDS